MELRTSFWLAPSRRHQQALRPPGGEDARCVRPISATQTNHVHPHLARSRLALAAFAAGTSYGVWGSVGLTGGPGVFTTPEDRFGGSSSITALVLLASRPLGARAWAFSSHGGRCDRASDTPVATSSFHPHASSAFAPAATWPCVLSPRFEEEGWHGSEGGETAEIIVHAVS